MNTINTMNTMNTLNTVESGSQSPMPIYQGMKLSPSEKRILIMLSDGRPHKKGELMAAVYRPDSGDKTVKRIQQFFSHIRKQLRRRGQDIVCVYREASYQYQWVRLLRGVETYSDEPREDT